MVAWQVINTVWNVSPGKIISPSVAGSSHFIIPYIWPNFNFSESIVLIIWWPKSGFKGIFRVFLFLLEQDGYKSSNSTSVLRSSLVSLETSGICEKVRHQLTPGEYPLSWDEHTLSPAELIRAPVTQTILIPLRGFFPSLHTVRKMSCFSLQAVSLSRTGGGRKNLLIYFTSYKKKDASQNLFGSRNYVPGLCTLPVFKVTQPFLQLRMYHYKVTS